MTGNHPARELIRLENVSITRGGKKVLTGIDWTVNRGENWVVMGNNGSGKTTLLEILLGYLWPRQGTVVVLGETFGRSCLPELRKKVGFIAPWVFKHIRDSMPVWKVVAAGKDASVVLSGKISNALRMRARKHLKFFGCLDLEGRLFGELSSGQQLKVAFARALAASPEVLVLDEPFSLLDIGSRLNLYTIIGKMVRLKDGPSLLMTTHHLEDIQPFFTHALLLKQGRIFKKGKIVDVLNPRYLTGAFGVPLGKNFFGASL